MTLKIPPPHTFGLPLYFSITSPQSVAHLIPCLAIMADSTLSRVDSTTDEEWPFSWNVHLQDSAEVDMLHEKLVYVLNENPNIECRMTMDFDATGVHTQPSTSSQPEPQLQPKNFTHLYTPIRPEDVVISEADSTTSYIEPTNWKLVVDTLHKVDLVCDKLKELMMQDPGLRFKIDLFFIWGAPARDSSSDSSPSTTDEEEEDD